MLISLIIITLKKIICFYLYSGFGMNSHELNVNVPLATVESDSEEIEVSI